MTENDTKNELTPKQRLIIEALLKSFGSPAHAALFLGIDVRTVNRYIASCPECRAAKEAGRLRAAERDDEM